jgi:flagellar motor switch protein FliM
VPATVRAERPTLENAADKELRRALGWDPTVDAVELRLARGALAQLVDRFYGGDGNGAHEAKALSASEDRFFDRLAKSVAPLLGAAWRRFRSIEPKLLSSVGAPVPTMVQTLSVACGDWAPFELKFSYPVATLDWLTATVHGNQDAGEEAARGSWSQDLTALVLTVPFPVRTILAEPEVAISQLSRLAVGDVLSIRVPPQMDLCVAGIRIAKGTVGDQEGRAAFRLD